MLFEHDEAFVFVPHFCLGDECPERLLQLRQRERAFAVGVAGVEELINICRSRGNAIVGIIRC